MAIQLYEYNEHACQAAERLLADEGRAAIVHPTGTGKSMIAFRLAQKNLHQRFLWLSPSEYIVRTQLENVRKADPSADFSHVQFMTYARLMMLVDEELRMLQPDFVILDEFHRCGAEMWGEGVQRLLGMYPDVLLLGLSATKIRYLDHQRDMADELFDGHIASEMSLGEAVVRGILPAPKYVTTVYQYQQGLARYEQRIRSMRSCCQREKSEKYLQALRRAMEQADGLDVMFHKYMTAKSGRYIVFCSGVQHMKDMHARVSEWFGRIDPQPQCYFVSAENGESPEEYEAFRRDESDHLKLLFCVNMLNEGVHVDGVSGVILFRPTISPIIYKQQIGRALTAGKHHEPLILDVVNNIEGLYSIGTIQQEMDDAVHRFRSSGQGNLIVQERFRVIDQVQSCRTLFEQMEESLHIDWEEYFQEAVRYREIHGDLLIPQRYVTEEGKCLGAWLNSQRNIRSGSKAGKLTPAQIQRLEDIGMIWGNLAEESWEQHFREAEFYLQEHGDLNIPSSYVDRTGFALGKWILRMRQKHQHPDALTDKEKDRLARLEQIGMIWDCWDRQWSKNFAHAKAYYQEHGHLQVAADYRTSDGFMLGQWIVKLRAIYKGSMPDRKLTKEQIMKLNEIGMCWGDIRKDRWMQWYDAAKAYYQKNGNLAVRKDYVTEDGQALGVWLLNQRMNRKRNEGTSRAMPPERIHLLDELGMKW